MTVSTITKPPRWFLAVAVLALLWNLLGVAAYLNQMVMDLSVLPVAQRAFFESIPTWATSAFAIAVFAGTAGSVGLLLKRRWSIPLFFVSSIGIVVQLIHSLLIGKSLEIFGRSALIVPAVTFAISLVLIWFAVLSKNKAWI